MYRPDSPVSIPYLPSESVGEEKDTNHKPVRFYPSLIFTRPQTLTGEFKAKPQEQKDVGSLWFGLEFTTWVTCTLENKSHLPSPALLKKYHLEKDEKNLDADAKHGGRASEIYWVHKGFLCQVLRIAYRKHYNIGFIANGNLCNRENFFGRLEKDPRLVELQNQLLGNEQHFFFCGRENRSLQLEFLDRRRYREFGSQNSNFIVTTHNKKDVIYYYLLAQHGFSEEVINNNNYLIDASSSHIERFNEKIQGIKADIVSPSVTNVVSLHETFECLNKINAILYPRYPKLKIISDRLGDSYASITDLIDQWLEDQKSQDSFYQDISNLAAMDLSALRDEKEDLELQDYLNTLTAQIKAEQKEIFDLLVQRNKSKPEYQSIDFTKFTQTWNKKILLLKQQLPLLRQAFAILPSISDFTELKRTRPNLKKIIENFAANLQLYKKSIINQITYPSLDLSIDKKDLEAKDQVLDPLDKYTYECEKIKQRFSALYKTLFTAKTEECLATLNAKTINLRTRYWGADSHTADILNHGLENIIELIKTFAIEFLKNPTNTNTELLISIQTLANNEVLRAHRRFTCCGVVLCFFVVAVDQLRRLPCSIIFMNQSKLL